MSWNIQTGKRINQFKGHKLSIECIKVIEDVMYTGSADCTVRSWNVKVTKNFLENFPLIIM